jgi:hypothetical protein
MANNLLDLEDVKDDLLNGDVLKQATPANAFRKLKDELCPLETGVQALNLHSRDVSKVEDNTRLALRLTCAFLRVEFERKITTFLALFNNDQPSNDLHWANRTPLRLDHAKLFWWWEPRDRERRR